MEWCSIESTFSNLNNARKLKQDTDVKIVCRNGDEIYAHRLILISVSAYFKRKLCNILINNLHFKNVNAKLMEIIVEFIYIRQLPDINDVKTLKAIVKISEKMKLITLSVECLKLLIDMLNIDNYIYVWNLADKYNDGCVQSCVARFGMSKAREIRDSEEVVLMREKQLEQFVITAGGYINTDLILSVIKKWEMYYEMKRSVIANRLIALLDQELILYDVGRVNPGRERRDFKPIKG